MSRLSLCSTALCFGAGVLIAANALAQPGAVDQGFDAGRGALRAVSGWGRSVRIQPDGKILVAGYFNALNLDFVPAVLRFNPNGSLDTGFNASAVPGPGAYDYDYGPKLLSLQPNGQILLGGTVPTTESGERYLTRVNANGSLDTTFNPDFRNGNFPAAILQASILADGKILIAGRFTSINGTPRSSLVRLNADGSLDTTFTPPQWSSASFVTQSSGKIVVSSGSDRIIRLNTDGSVDNTFATVVAPAGYTAGGLLVEPDDKVIWTATWAGWVLDWPPTIISRLNADGTSDPDFTPFQSYAGNPLLLQQDGKLIIFSIPYGEEVWTWRLNIDGTPDPSFQPIWLGSFAQQADGRLIVVGDIYEKPYGVRRLFLNGSNDDSFSPGVGLGLVERRSIDQICLLPNGKIVIAGNFTYVHSVPRLRIAVLDHSGAVDLNFDAGTLLGEPQLNSPFDTMAAQGDGKILVAFENSLVRLNPNGQIDGTFLYHPISIYYIERLLVQPNGKILVNDTAGNVVRLNQDGSQDSTFHTDQMASVEFIQPDTKILIRTPHALIRLNADGSVDPEFDSSATSEFFGPAFVAYQPNGMFLISHHPEGLIRIFSNGIIDNTFDPAFHQISLASVDRTGIYLPANLAPTGEPSDFEVVRLFNDGSRAPNFTVEFNSGATVKTLLIEPDGQLLVSGQFDQVNGVQRVGVVRLNGAAPKKLANISTRVRVGTAQSVEIGGFIITGNASKQVIVRALGPSLIHSGLNGSDLLANPYLELHDSTGAIIAQNDNWRDTQEPEIRATGIPPTEDVESAIVSTCTPGYYTAVVQGRDGGDGIALVEAYDLDPAADSNLANISTRGAVNTDEGVMIAGFILRGPGSSTIIVRALGPSLTAAGINAALADPTLTVYDQTGSIIAFNDEWRATQEAELEAYGMGPANDHEAALIAIPSPGPYTAIVRGANNQGGVGLVEVYQVK